MFDDIRARVGAYYTEKLERFGETPQGVDWNSVEAQDTRFTQILSVCRDEPAFTINDIGCGYGALIDRCVNLPGFVSYVGFDISAKMIEAASRRYSALPNVSFTSTLDDVAPADFSVASGIFSVKGEVSQADWLEYIVSTLRSMRAVSTRGFSFNCLTSASDPDRMRPDLYYADFLTMFEFCRKEFSRNVALLHDYNLYEFTIRVRL